MRIQKVSAKEIAVEQFKNYTAGQDYLVAWYGGLRKNNVARSVPNVVVFLRKLDDNYSPYGWVGMPLALTQLGLLRIGSIWRDGELHSQLEFPSETFKVDFTPGKWQFISPETELADGKPNPIDPNDYALQYKADKNWLINFPLPRGKNLLIPCLEFFCRCYGASLEVNRVLATYPWYEVEDRFYDPSYGDNTTDGWHVKLRHRMHKNDVILLAHLKYDMDAQKKAKSIYAQLESTLQQDSTAFPKIGPWFEGKAEIRVAGHWINGGKTFLALRVTGCSDPSGEKIYRTREQAFTKQEGHISPDGSDFTTFPIQRFSPGAIIDVTTAEEPDNPSEWLSIQGDDFAVLGKPRTVIDKKSERDPNRVRVIPTADDDDSINKVSGGEAYGRGKGTGSGVIVEQRVLESAGVLRDMWNALLQIKEKNKKTITSAQWYTFKDGFRSDPEPKCIALLTVDTESDAEEHFPKDAINWVYVDPYNTRGVLVMRIGAMMQTMIGIPQEKFIYIVEVDRRIRSVKKGENRDAAEENYKGLVFMLKDDRTLNETLKHYMFNIRRVKGVVSKLTDKIPGKAYTFKHTPSKDDKFPCEQTVKLALAKVGVKVE